MWWNIRSRHISSPSHLLLRQKLNSLIRLSPNWHMERTSLSILRKIMTTLLIFTFRGVMKVSTLLKSGERMGKILPMLRLASHSNNLVSTFPSIRILLLIKMEKFLLESCCKSPSWPSKPTRMASSPLDHGSSTILERVSTMEEDLLDTKAIKFIEKLESPSLFLCQPSSISTMTSSSSNKKKESFITKLQASS